MHRYTFHILSIMLEKSFLDVVVLPQTQRGVQRREALLHSAYELFLHHGYDNVCLDDIVQRAGGSKASVYKYFGNKEGLLLAICDYHFTERFKLLSPPFQEHQTLHDYLYQVLLNAYYSLQEPHNVAFIHLILHQSKPNPDLIQHLSQKWRDNILKNIQTILADAHQKNILQCDNIQLSSIYFWGIIHEFHWSAILNKEPLIQSKDIEYYLHYSVDIFLAGHHYRKKL